jgi:hypothetical protein
MSDVDAELVLGKIFESAIETKRKVGQLYQQFADLFSHVPEVQDFWRKMNLNQITHADWLQETKESLSEDQILSLPEVELVLKTHSIRNLFDRHSEKEISTLLDAYEIAHEFELSEVNELFRILSRQYISCEEKKNLVLDTMEKHKQEIIDLAKRFASGMIKIKANSPSV